ncbi:hypothetical protein [Nonomuraea soli]|uniref:Uncharacterized protein n=1 Tax=Nonomuraea soli TaxID=1032476 RepID=A0A7W0CQV8_9ACTN|nr:hypothetical protein [Nonomuraea soli]MBA2895620.1 hypothetical protein [Nonomuraea soli]
MHLLAVSALALGLVAAPTTAPKVVYGYAWADGTNKLRILPTSATNAKQRYTLKLKKGAKELRLDYAKASYRRVTVACDRKETEGEVNVDKLGRGKTPCKAKDLAFTLGQGPVAVRLEYSGSKATRVTEIMTSALRFTTVQGTASRAGDGTLLFKGRKLGYTWMSSFYRVTAKCRDGWLTGEPVNASRDGLGTKQCTHTDLNRISKTWKYPVLVQLSYEPVSGYVSELWEVFGDA